MKKLIAILLVMVMCLSMSGCALILNLAKQGAEKITTETDVIYDDEAPADDTPEVEETPEEADPFEGLSFYSYDGVSLFMEDGMVESEGEGFTVYAYSNTSMFAGIKEDASVFTDAGLDINDFTLEDYAEIVQNGNGLETPFAVDAAGNLSATYNSNQNGTDFFYYATVKQGTDAFWVFTFACFAEDEALYLPQFQLWASSMVLD